MLPEQNDVEPIYSNALAKTDETEIAALIQREFTSGHNVYVTDLISLSRTVLALVGGTGRHGFLLEVGRQLDEYRSDIRHRRAWARLLEAA